MGKTAYILISGERRIGKSTLVANVATRAQGRGLKVGGIIAESTWKKDGSKDGIDAYNLDNGERRQLATIVKDAKTTTVGEYAFDMKTADWALKVMQQALATPLDLVIIDEMGRLELFYGCGYAPLIPLLATAQPRVVMILVREGYVNSLLEKSGIEPKAIIKVDEANRDKLPERLYRRLRKLLRESEGA